MMQTKVTMLMSIVAALSTYSGPPAAADAPPAGLQIVAEFLQSSQSRRVDVVGIGDSNQRFQSWGRDHGVAHGMLEAGLSMYASQLSSAAENGGLGGGVGYAGSGHPTSIQYRAASAVANTLADGGDRGNAPCPAQVFMDTVALVDANLFAPCEPLYWSLENTVSTASLGASVGLRLYPQNPLDNQSTLSFHLWHVPLETSEGAVAWRVLDNTSGAFVTIVSEVFMPNSPANPFSPARRTLTIPADPQRTGMIELRAPVGSQSQPPFFLTWSRAVNDDRLHGFSLTTLYGAGGKAAYHMATAFLEFPDETWGHFLHALTADQKVPDHEKRAMFVLNTGLNDRNVTEKLPGAPDGPANSPQVVQFNVQTIVDRITERWLAAGFDPGKLVIWLVPSHPVSEPDHPLLLAYRVVMREIAVASPRVAFSNLALLTDHAELTAPGEPQYWLNGSDVHHLSPAAYGILGTRLVEEAIESCPSPGSADLNCDGSVSVADLLILLAAWGLCSAPQPCMGDITGDGQVGVPDLLQLLTQWG